MNLKNWKEVELKLRKWSVNEDVEKMNEQKFVTDKELKKYKELSVINNKYEDDEVEDNLVNVLS